MLIYIFPALFDVVIGQIFFVNAVRLAQMGCSDIVITGLGACWFASYALFCFIAGKSLFRQSSLRMIIIACGLMFFICGSFLFTNTVVLVYILIGLSAVSGSLFFPAFQVFMKEMDGKRSRPLAFSIGFYTFSLSLGVALGPFFSGFIMEFGKYAWKYCFLISCIICVIIGVGILLYKYYAENEITGKIYDRSEFEQRQKIYLNMPNLVWMGWISVGTSLIVMSLIRGLFPAMAEKELMLSENTQGEFFFFLSISQAFTGLFLCRSRIWMYKSGGVILFGLLGILGTFCLILKSSEYLLFFGAVCLGIYSGSYCFYFVFHAIVHSSKSAKYVTINEIIAGISGVIGSVMGGVLAEFYQSYKEPFMAGIIVIIATLIFLFVLHKKIYAHYAITNYNMVQY